MSADGSDRHGSEISRRDLIKKIGAAAGVAAFGPTALAQGQGAPQAPPIIPPRNVTTTPAREWGPDAGPTAYPDPDIVAIDPMFNRYRPGNTAIHRLWTGAMWSEGPAWCSQGRYL